MIIIISRLKYPEGDAGSIRLYGFAASLKKNGNNPFVIGYGKPTTNTEYYKNIPYISLRKNNRYLSSALFPLHVYTQLHKIITTHHIKSIIVGTIDAISLTLIKYLCRLQSIPIIVDVVEWYSPFQFKHGRYSLPYIEKNIINKYLITSKTRVIAISRYLEDYFSKKGIKVARIPIFMDQKNPFNRTTSEEYVTITYAGQPGRKDFLNVIIEAILGLDEYILNKLKFNLIGCSKEDIKQLCIDNNIDYSHIDLINIIGRISHDKVIEYLTSSDYTILIRDPNERYAMAGFPSKIIECITYGVVPIMNLTSDLGLYFKDGRDCIIVDGYDVTSLRISLERAISIPYDKRLVMSTSAKDLAIAYFGIETYYKELKQIVRENILS